MHDLSQDIRELLKLFAKHDVDFLICSGHAVAFHGYIRMTLDIDILVLPTPENARRITQALDELGFGDAGIPETAFCEPGTAISLGVQPNQVDLLTSISRQETAEVFAAAENGDLAGMHVRFVCLEDLLRAKREADRPKDRIDVAELEEIRRGGS